MLALQGIKIIDLTHLQPGWLCTMILGDLGANVIKVEAPAVVSGKGAGITQSTLEEFPEREVAFNALNRNKKSIGLNLKSEKGKEIFYQLVKSADVIIEGFRPGTVKRLGIDYHTIQQINCRIIYCSLSGYGQDGPYSQYPGHDINYLSLAGILDVIGNKDGPPVIPLNIIADFAGASLHGVIGIQSAIIAREKTGKGQYVDISYLDSALSLMTMFTSTYFSQNKVPKRGECALNGGYPYYNIYKAKDGKYISIGCNEPWFWSNLCHVLEKDEYASFHFESHHIYTSPDGEIWSEIFNFLKDTFLTKNSDEWIKLLRNHDIPATEVQSFNKIFFDPQVVHRKMVLEFDHTNFGKVKQIGIAVKLSDTPGQVRSLAPTLGENTEEILEELGYSSNQINEMRNKSIIA